MEDRPRDTLRQAAQIGLGALLLAGLLIWIMPELVQPLLGPSPTTRRSAQETHSIDDVDRSVQEWLRRVGAVEVLNRESDGVIRAIYRTPRGADNQQIVQAIRGYADEAEMEVYLRIVDGIDVELRAYRGPVLRQQLLLIPDLPSPPSYTKSVKDPSRPLISIIVIGLGESKASNIINQPVPITIAIKPFTPFALRIARLAASSWHEVIVDLPPEMTAAEAQHAIPNASGLWVDGTSVKPLRPEDVVVLPAERMGRRRAGTKDTIRRLPVQQRERRTAMETLQRVRHIAARAGVGALVLEADDPELSKVLAWAAQAHRQGYRMVLATEASRASEVQGPNRGLTSASEAGAIGNFAPR
jgi:hypothetical protein